MTIPWQPGNQGHMEVPPGYIDPHSSTIPTVFPQSVFYDEPAGTIARTMDRRRLATFGAAAVNTTGTVGVTGIGLTAGMLISNIEVMAAGAATGPTHFWLGLADVNLNVLGVTADQGSAAISANTFYKLALTSPVAIISSGLYYVLASTSASTTAPTLQGASVSAQVVAAVPILCGTAGTQATPPAIGAQLASGTVTATANANYAAWLS